jgi:hypothetical protein
VNSSRGNNVKKSIALLLAFCLCGLFSCSKQEEDPFPPLHELESSRAGEVIWRSGVLDAEGKEYQADFGLIYVPENRGKNDSRLIDLPMAR